MEKVAQLDLTKVQKQKLKEMLYYNAQLFHCAYQWKQEHSTLYQSRSDYVKWLKLLPKISANHTVKRAQMASEDIKYKYLNLYLQANKYNGRKFDLDIMHIPFNKMDVSNYNVSAIYIMYRKEKFYIKFFYTMKKEEQHKVLSIDVGVDNLGACATNFGDSFLIDGMKLKAWDYYYLKKVNFLKGINPNSKRIQKLKDKHFKYMNTYCEKASNYVKQYCMDNHIDFMLVGKIPTKKSLSYHTFMTMEYKRDNITAFGMSLFIKNLKQICKNNEWKYESIAEDYSSQCSFYDNEDVRMSKNHLGKRVHRGLYRTQNRKYVNADVNAAYNFIRKYGRINKQYKQYIDNSSCRKNIVLHPKRIRFKD